MQMRTARAGDTSGVADEAATQVSLHDPGGLVWLLEEMREAGADSAARVLARRAANAGMFWLFFDALPDGKPGTGSGPSQTELPRHVGDGRNQQASAALHQTDSWRGG
jgi:hypothetical protein